MTMKLSYNKRSKDPIYYVAQTIRNGKKTTTRTICRIGKHSELAVKCDDPLDYAKKVVAQYNKEAASDKNEDVLLHVDFDKNVGSIDSTYSKQTNLNIGYFVLQQIYQQLGIKSFMNEISKDTKVTFNCDDINRFLTFARILEPKSKYGTFDNINHYFDHPDIKLYVHLLRFMDILVTNKDDYIDMLYKNSNNVVKRDTSVCYYDCTNYYFHLKQDDSIYDEIDPVTGELWRSYHMYGRSKENRPLPIVQMGLYMDSQGIPLSMCITPGNTNEQKTALPLEEKLRRSLDNQRFIYCADAGLGSYEIRKTNNRNGNGYIVTQSLKKLSEELRNKCFNDDGFKLISNNEKVKLNDLKTFDKNDSKNLNLYKDKAYKVVKTKLFDDLSVKLKKVDKQSNSKSKNEEVSEFIEQNVIVTFSREYMEYQLHVQEMQIERAKRLISSGKIDKLGKSQSDPKRFVKKVEKNKKDTYELDKKLIEEEQKYFGFYAIATNLIDERDDPREIIAINSRRWKIEECFRVLKTDFSSRPIYHQVDRRIEAHFLICYTALLIYRLLEIQLKDKGYNVTTNDILTTLRNMNVTNVSDVYYFSNYTSSTTLEGINALYPDLKLTKENHKPKDLHKILRNISK